MPQFGQQDGFQTVAYTAGPAHVLLGLRFDDGEQRTFELVKRPAIGACDHGQLDEARIAKAVVAGVARANAETGAVRSIVRAFYVENDSPRYDLYEHCAYLLASRP